jgi:hypothetical protein
MSKVTTPSIAFNRMRNDVHRLIALEYISPALRDHAKMMLPLLDMMESKFTAAFFDHTQSPTKLTDQKRAKLAAARDKAIRDAQIAVVKNEPFTRNPYPAGNELHSEWHKAWHFYTDGAPGGNQGYYSYDPPTNPEGNTDA